MANREMQFTQKALVPVKVSGISVTLYPVLDNSMTTAERAHGYHVCKSNLLASSALSPRQILNAIGQQTGQSAVVDGAVAGLLRHFHDHWRNFRNLTILSWHDSTGAIMNNTTVAGNASVLLPILNGALANCRQQDVKFVRVQVSVDYTYTMAGVTPIRLDFYVELPQTSTAMTNGAGNAYTLVTYAGPDDLRTLDTAQTTATILGVTHQTEPGQIQAPAFGATAATLTQNAMTEIESKILRVCMDSVFTSIFLAVAPNFTNQPEAALEYVMQIYTDPDGKQVYRPVQEYYTQIMGAIQPFVAQRVFPVNVVEKFKSNMDPGLRDFFKKAYPTWSAAVPLQGDLQLAELRAILIAAQTAEDDRNLITNQTSRVINATGFMIQGAQINASQAEKTIANHKRKDGSPILCFGCGGPHPWSSRQPDKSFVVICPNKDKPGVKEKADAQIADLRSRRKSRTDRDNNRKKQKTTTNAASGDSTSVVVPSPNGRVVFVASVLLNDSEIRQPMPVAISQNMPHMLLGLGPTAETPNCPDIRCAIDTCAGLNTGSYRYLMALARKFPHCLYRIYTSKEFAPIVLSGIVQDGENAITTTLDVTFQFFLPYTLSGDGGSCMISIAAGKDVAVNVILGIPFILAMKMNLDFVDNVATCKALDHPPFPIEMRRTSNIVPSDVEVNAAQTVSDTIAQLDRFDKFYSAQVATIPRIQIENGTSNSVLRTNSRWGPTVDTTQAASSPSAASGTDTIAVLPPDSTITPAPILSNNQNMLHHSETRMVTFMPQNPPVSGDQSSALSSEPGEPIRLAPKPKRRKRQHHNILLDDRGFPDQSDEFDYLLNNVDARPVLRKLLHPAPALDGPVDPEFKSVFDPAVHESLMREDLDLSHLAPDVQEQVYSIIREFWSVFDGKGYTVPVKNYECIIDTGTATPIAVKKINYGDNEIPIMRKCIAKLAEVGHIRQIHEGGWLFKALLAPKPHQEHIYNIDDFVWRFCVNYIPLNMVTRPIAYPIPRCDSAVHSEFGCGPDGLMWLYDAPQGYHQLRVATESQLKLAFQGPDAIKWTYNVMPFGPTNGPATFINFAHDVCSVWQEYARKLGVPIGIEFDTRIIVDDFVNWGATLALSLLYIRCQLTVCQAYNLSLSLKKMRVFPERFEFVGFDVTPDGNLPAKSKHILLEQWPRPNDVRDVSKFIGFAQFYSRFIPHFELRITTLRSLVGSDYSQTLGDSWTLQAQSEFDDMRNAILADPCIKRFDSSKLVVLRTDFSSIGFGWCLLQPGNDTASVTAAQDYRDGKGFSFMTKSSQATLNPVCFGARRTRGNESKLHSHLGEGFAGDFAINKCRQYLFAQRFVWVTDCYAIKFIMSYDGSNPAILRLQMRLMCWDVDIVHRPDTELVDADYWSRLGVDLLYDPLYTQYLQQTRQYRTSHPVVSELPMLPANMPYYRGPRIQPTADETVAEASHIQTLMTAIATPMPTSSTTLSITPVMFLNSHHHAVPAPNAKARYNSEFASYALQVSEFSWAVYNFSNGHFSSSIQSLTLAFGIRIGCDTTQRGRSLFREFAPDAQVFNTGNDFLNHIRSSGDRSVLHGYLINTFRFRTTEITNTFWQLQLQIVAQLRLIRSTSVIVALVIPDLDGSATAKFVKGLESAHWIVTCQKVHYVDIGDSIDDSCVIITAVHSSCAPQVDPINLILPPKCDPPPIAAYIHEPFNDPRYSVSYGRGDTLFNSDEACQVTCNDPPARESLIPPSVKHAYSLHRDGDQLATTAGAMVLSSSGLCPPFEWCSSQNAFQHLFGIEFNHNGHVYVRPFSTFEFTRCFNLTENLQYRLSHDDYKFALDAAMPAFTSGWLFSQVNVTLEVLRASNTEIFTPNQIAAPAATIQTLLNGSTSTKLPSHSRWATAYQNDIEMMAVRHLVLNPSAISNTTLADVNYNYRMPLRRSQIVIEDDMLIFREPISGTTSFTRLQIVPKELYNIIFIAFHANPIGGHLNAYRTLHRIRLRFYFPHMWKYITRMCNACPGCSLSNPTKRASSELVYNFPVQAPFVVMYFDAYMAGKHQSFEGNDCYLIGCCGMTGFACSEPVSQPSAKTFASSIMKILLRFGICATAVLDKDSKFYGVCREALDLIQINCHTLSGGNHNPMMVERICRYLNKSLRIFCSERDSVRVSQEAILLSLYAWNSCPIPGTDISRSFCAIGREFAFPIDYSTQKHWELTSSAPTIESYSKNLAKHLAASTEVAKLLVEETRAAHREYINARRPNPKIYSVGDTVFARRAVKSNASRGQVGKLQNAYTGPWRVTKILDGASYELQHLRHGDKKEKKHASDLSPYPEELIAFDPLDGPDNRYGQLHKPISAERFDNAGLHGFLPSNPYKQYDEDIPSNFLMAKERFKWPSLSDLNDELDENLWNSDPDIKKWRAAELVHEFVPALQATTRNALRQGLPDIAPGPPPSAPIITMPTFPTSSALLAAMLVKKDRLFFISISIGTNDAREWRLVRLNLELSVAHSFSCLETGHFMCEFYRCHPADWRFNAVNQRFWLQYFKDADLLHADPAADNHLIKPSDSSNAYAIKNHLVTARKFVHVLHHDTFIHGPFDFATVHGRKTRDRIAHADWQALANHSHMFQNPVPSFDVPTYSIHVDNGVHFSCPGTHHDTFDHMFGIPSDDDASLFSAVDDNDTGSPQGGTDV